MISTMQLITKKPDNSHPAYRNPSTIIPTPTSSAIVHFIQPGIRFSSLRSYFSVSRTTVILAMAFLAVYCCFAPFIFAPLTPSHHSQ
jgi:hypothetical protein